MKAASVLLTAACEVLPFLKTRQKNLRISSLILIIANLIPLIGVVFLKWNPFLILIIYWAENVIVGVLNVLKMIISGAIRPGGIFSFWRGFGSLFPSAFFLVHYGGFMFGHGIFLFLFTFGFFHPDGPQELGAAFDRFFVVLEENLAGIQNPVGFLDSELFGLTVILLSHLYAFYAHFLKPGEYGEKGPMDYMPKPYSRVVIMQITIIAGAFPLMMYRFQTAPAGE
jgi:hypothetical protein